MYRILVLIAVAGTVLAFAGTGRADVPAPPVEQTLGMFDGLIGAVTEAECRACHDPGVPDRHHNLYGTDRGGATPPYPDPGGGTTWTCINCHSDTFIVERDCVVCHTSSAHHTTQDAQDRHCTICHGDIVDDFDDPHVIPTYAPSLVTPTRSAGAGLPLRGSIGAGGCNYCHLADAPQSIESMMTLHHAARDGAGLACEVCHDSPLDTSQIRVCEECHGHESLHNIQADSPNSNNVGTLVVGGEDAGYGHVGRDAGPTDSDCWGCHGFVFTSAPGSGPLIPTVYSADLTTMNAGTDTMVVLTGAAFTNFAGSTLFESDVAMTGADGSSVTLTPDLMDQGLLAVTIPGDTAPGNYDLRAVKADFESNPVPISIVPGVVITDATSDGTVTIKGSGFGGYAEGSGTLVTATVAGKGKGRKKESTTEMATIVSWSDTEIEADFSSSPEDVTVHSVFGDATSEVDSGKPGKGGGNNKGKKRR